LKFENGFEIIRCPYCGAVFHHIRGFEGENGKPITYNIHVTIEEATRGIQKSINLFNKISNRINKKCRKVKILLTSDPEINLRDILGMRKAKLRANGEDWGDCALENWAYCSGVGASGKCPYVDICRPKLFSVKT
jgi:hypothetical protein